MNPSERAEHDDGTAQALERLHRLCRAANDSAALRALDVLKAHLVTERVAEHARSGDDRARVERTAAQQSFQARILEAIANGVMTLSPQNTITTFNRSAEATFGIAAEAMLGEHALVIAKFVRKFPELLDTFFKSGAVQLRAEVAARRADGTRLRLQISLSPLPGAGAAAGVAIVLIDVSRQRELEELNVAHATKAGRVAESFSRHLAAHVVTSLMDDPASVKLGGERRQATILFADVRGFTAIASTFDPERVVDILNTYFEEAVRIVFDYDGLLDKFYGDGLMAVFGPPHMHPDDASRAVGAAIRLQRAVPALRKRLDYPLEISVGIASGEVVAGHFGSTRRMDYTVVGDAVNLANGLQSVAPAGQIYCDARTISLAGAHAATTRRIDVKIKGRDALVTAFALRTEPNA